LLEKLKTLSNYKKIYFLEVGLKKKLFKRKNSNLKIN
jgi:hypothetical protein